MTSVWSGGRWRSSQGYVGTLEYVSLEWFGEANLQITLVSGRSGRSVRSGSVEPKCSRCSSSGSGAPRWVVRWLARWVDRLASCSSSLRFGALASAQRSVVRTTTIGRRTAPAWACWVGPVGTYVQVWCVEARCVACWSTFVWSTGRA